MTSRHGAPLPACQSKRLGKYTPQPEARLFSVVTTDQVSSTVDTATALISHVPTQHVDFDTPTIPVHMQHEPAP